MMCPAQISLQFTGTLRIFVRARNKILGFCRVITSILCLLFHTPNLLVTFSDHLQGPLQSLQPNPSTIKLFIPRNHLRGSYTSSLHSTKSRGVPCNRTGAEFSVQMPSPPLSTSENLYNSVLLSETGSPLVNDRTV